jgi:hypothetical protein
MPGAKSLNPRECSAGLSPVHFTVAIAVGDTCQQTGQTSVASRPGEESALDRVGHCHSSDFSNQVTKDTTKVQSR